MNIPIEAKIKCPFYQGFRNSVLCCEGIVDKTCMTTKFPSVNARTDYIKAHCFSADGNGCVFARELYEKYRKIEEAEDRKRIKNAISALKKTG
ncbi:MAG: hypothetical protein IJA39_05850 [Clostridia bacterium]|nr:hypothetical protein [Clostridia bacterium]